MENLTAARTNISTLLGGKPTPTLFTSGVQVSLAFLFVPAILKPPRGLCVLCVALQEWNTLFHKPVAWPAHSPGQESAHVISLTLSPTPGAGGPDLFDSSHSTQLHVYLSLALVLWESFWKFSVSFLWKFSTCSCIFSVSVGRWVHIFLHHHLDFWIQVTFKL